MNRVLKRGGKFVIMDLEAAEEPLREIADRIETMRDLSHVKNRSRDEFVALYKKHGYTITTQELTPLPQPLISWMELTQTPNDVREKIIKLMKDELNGGQPTGFRPHLIEGEIYFEHRYILFIGIKD